MPIKLRAAPKGGKRDPLVLKMDKIKFSGNASQTPKVSKLAASEADLRSWFTKHELPADKAEERKE